MNPEFKKRLSAISDKDLQEYLDHRQRYEPAAVQAAIEEWKLRGRIFTEEELQELKGDLLKKQEEMIRNEKRSMSSEYETNDPNAPLLYSKMSIILFSIFSTVLFGIIFSAINMNRCGKSKGMGEVLVLGGFIFIAEIVLVLSSNNLNILVFCLNAVSAYIFTEVLWTKHIGKTTPYRTANVTFPLIIALVLMLVYVMMMCTRR